MKKIKNLKTFDDLSAYIYEMCKDSKFINKMDAITSSPADIAQNDNERNVIENKLYKDTVKFMQKLTPEDQLALSRILYGLQYLANDRGASDPYC